MTFRAKNLDLQPLLCICFQMPRLPLTSVRRSGQKQTVGTRRTAARACFGPSASSAPLAPLQLESPAGQFLSRILRDHPHLLPAAVDQQLEMLQTDRDAAEQKEKPAASETDLVLYRFACRDIFLARPICLPSLVVFSLKVSHMVMLSTFCNILGELLK